MPKMAAPGMIPLGVGLGIVGYLILTAVNCATPMQCNDPVAPYASALLVVGTLITLSSGIVRNTYRSKR